MSTTNLERLQRLSDFLDAYLTSDPKPNIELRNGPNSEVDLYISMGTSTSMCLNGQQVLSLLEDLPEDRHYASLALWADHVQDMLTARDGERTLVAIAVRSQDQADERGLICKPTRNPLIDLVLAFDTPDSVMTIMANERDSAMPEQEMFSTGVANVKASKSSVTAAGCGVERCVSINGYYAATIALLDPERVRNLAVEHDIPAPWMLCVPDRSTAVISSAACPRHVVRVAMACTEDHMVADQSTRLFSSPLELSPDGVAGMTLVHNEVL